MLPHPLTVPAHFSPPFSDAASLSRRAVCAGGKSYHIDPSTGQAMCRCHLPSSTLPLSPVHNTSGPAAHNSPNHSPVAVHLPPFTAVRAGASLHDQLSVTGLGKDPMSTRTIPIGGPYTPAALAAYHPYLYAGYEPGGIRKAAVRETTGPLKAWLHEHKKNPYPTKAEKVMLAIITQMTLTQVSTWFANARRRLKKETRGTWEGSPDHDDDKDSTGRSEGKDADSTITDHYENFSDVSVDDDDVENNTAGSSRDSTSPAESRLFPVPPPSFPPHHHHHHHHQHPLLLSPLHPHPASLPLRPEVTSEHARSSGNGESAGSRRNNVEAARVPAPVAPAKPRIWSISAIIGLDEKDSTVEKEEKSDSGSSSGKNDVDSAPYVSAESDSTDSGVGDSEPLCSTSSSHGSPLSAESP